MSTRFALHPGYVRSQTDGDRHYVGASLLIWLYGLLPGSYVVWDERAAGRRWDDFVHLFPRYDGNYQRVAQ